MFADLALARRLERAEATSAVRNVEGRARVFPERGATWTEIAGAYALFDGPESPVTQTFGLGLFQTPTIDDFAAIEAFFTERGAPVFHEVAPLADAQTFTLLSARGYQPIEFTSVMFRSLADLAGQAIGRRRPAHVPHVKKPPPRKLQRRRSNQQQGWRMPSGFVRPCSRARPSISP